MRRSIVSIAGAAAVLAFTVLCAPVSAWVKVGDGIEYQSFTAAGPNNLFVCRMARNNTNAILESMIGSGFINDGASEIVRNQAARYDEAINWWGQEWGKRNDVVVAVNGDFFASSIPSGGQHHAGWQAKQYGNFGGFSGFGYRLDRNPFVGGCINNIASNQYAYFLSNGTTIRFDGINIARTTDTMMIYTPQYNTRTPAATSGVEVLVELPRPMLMAGGSAGTVGTIKQIWQNSGSHYIPFDHVVLSADGSKATSLLAAAVVGQQVRISQYINDYNPPDTCGNNGCNYNTGVIWENTYASVGQNYHFVRNGVLWPPDSVCHPGYIGLTNLNPRTALAYNSTYIYFIVCDGRSASSVGMGLAQLGQWCIDVLQATEAVNLDGGGSSTMVVNGVVKNVPSDGSERAVANGFAIVNVLPKLQSTLFSAGQTVTVNAATTRVYLGPNDTVGYSATVGNNTVGTIAAHALNGIYSKNKFWWYVDFGGGTVGWIEEMRLIQDAAAPTVVQHPVSTTACSGETAKFRVAATGRTTALGYRWQKNGVNLSDGGHYSGVLTPELIISNIDPNDYASYRCGVTNSYGTTYSDSATLSPGSQPAAPGALPASNIGTDTIKWNWSAVPEAQYYQLWTAASGGTQIGGTIDTNSYTETGLNPGTSYTRYVESVGCGVSAARTPLGPAATTARYCPENGGFEGGFTGGIGNHWIKASGGDGTESYSSSSTAHSGTYSQRVEDPVGGQAYTPWVYQKINLQPGRQYVLSYWSWRATTSGFVTAINYNADGGDLSGNGWETGAGAAGGAWTRKVLNPFTAGAGGLVTIGFRGGANGGDTYGLVDDFIIAPAPPTSSGGGGTICNGQSATVTASGGFGGTSSELHWYTGPNGTGTHVGTGASLVVSPTATTTYYPRWQAASNCGGCCISDDGPAVTVTVNNCQPTVTSITPNYGPNTGTTSVTNLAGANFVSGASVKLARTGYADILAAGVTVEDPAKITCQIDLAGRKTGLWDVVVTNPGGLYSTLSNGFGVTVSDSKPAVGTTIASLVHSVASPGALNFRFRVWGRVETINSSLFWLDDGSGVRIKVFAPGYTGIVNGGFASAAGTADVSVSPPVLVSRPDRILGY